MNRGAARYQSLYLMISYLFSYVFLGRGGCEAICLFLLAPKKTLSLKNTCLDLLWILLSLPLPKLRASASFPSPAHVLAEVTFAALGPETESDSLSLLWSILLVIRSTWTGGVWAPEPSYWKRSGIESTQGAQTEHRMYFLGGEDVS